MCFYFTHSFLNRSTFHLDGPLFATPNFCASTLTKSIFDINWILLSHPDHNLGLNVHEKHGEKKCFCWIFKYTIEFSKKYDCLQMSTTSQFDFDKVWIVNAGTYLQPHYSNSVFGNVYLSAGQH